MTKEVDEVHTSWNNIVGTLMVICVLAGIYLFVLVLAPTSYLTFLPRTKIDLNTADDTVDMRDRIQIDKLQLEVGISAGGADSLDRGVWHRWPDRGDPERGGNFILSAHRFRIGLTPSATKINSPFFRLDQLAVGDRLRIFWHGSRYDYEIVKIYSVKPDAVEIEAPSTEAKLTLYTCSLSGSADGRVVVEARKI